MMGLSKTGRRLVVAGIVVVAAFALATAWLIQTQRTADLAASRQASAEIAQVIAEQTSRTIQPVDLTLREIADRFTAQQSERGDTDSQAKAMFDLLVERRKSLPQVDALIL
ncbi:MAG TPA: hypothetical protein VGF36_07885, partial [Rhodopila sp.]